MQCAAAHCELVSYSAPDRIGQIEIQDPRRWQGTRKDTLFFCHSKLPLKHDTVVKFPTIHGTERLRYIQYPCVAARIPALRTWVQLDDNRLA